MSAFRFDISINAGRRTLVDIEKFEVAPNKITFLFGESGIGKSIISKAFYGLLEDADLKIRINKLAYKNYLEKKIVQDFKENGFFVFQEPSTHLNPLRTLSKQLNEGSLAGLNVKDEETIIRFLWDDGDPQFLNRLLKVFPKPYRPSGGEKQRILLAMAFKKIKQYIDKKSETKTALFVFDEPSGSLDNRFRNLFLQLLIECYKQKPFTALIITHDYSIISEIETQYPALGKAVDYKELSRQDNGLKLELFSKKEYLDWISNQEMLNPESLKNEKLLTLRSPVNVFDKNLVFYRNGQGSKTTITDLEINTGALLYLKAQSGVGKTTIAKIIMGLVRAQKMQIHFTDQSVNQDSSEDFWRKNIWGKKASMVFQHADESLNQNASVWEVFKALPLTKKLDEKALATELQSLFDEKIKSSFLNKKVKFLSGGQKQRLNILRCFLLDTDILILDEPLNGLDLRSTHKVIEKIKQRQSQGKAILLISHNEEIFDSIIPKQNIIYLKAEDSQED